MSKRPGGSVDYPGKRQLDESTRLRGVCLIRQTFYVSVKPRGRYLWVREQGGTSIQFTINQTGAFNNIENAKIGG
jgi:hypothetical protein